MIVFIIIIIHDTERDGCVSVRVWSFSKFSSHLVIKYSFKAQLTPLTTALAFRSDSHKSANVIVVIYRLLMVCYYHRH